MPAGASDPQTPDEPVVGCVSVGSYRLVLGDSSGAAIVPAATKAELSQLAEALDDARSERERAPTVAAQFEGAVADASQVTGKVERAVTLFKEVAQGRLDPSAVSDEVNVLVGLLGKLDHEERFDDALRVARSLAMLLGLIERWLELLRSLESALSAAERLGDSAGKAWALHELGTLNLVAGRHADADRMLSKAHDLRRKAGDAHGLEITERNLQVLCRELRAQLHNKSRRRVLEWLVHRPAIAFLIAALLVIVGGVAGAAMRGSRNVADTVSNSSSPNGTITTTKAGTTTSTGKGKSTPTGKTTAAKTVTGNTPGQKSSKPAINSAGATTFEERFEDSFRVTATGTPAPTIMETGKLPDGVAFNGRVLAGIATMSGSFPIVFTATNSAGSFRQDFTLIVDPRATTTSEEPVTGTLRKPEAPPP